MDKPRLGGSLLPNTILFIFQLLGKLQPFLIVFNGLLEQFACFIYILGSFSICKIMMTKPNLDVDLFTNTNTGLFLRQLFGKFQSLPIVFNG